MLQSNHKEVTVFMMIKTKKTRENRLNAWNLMQINSLSNSKNIKHFWLKLMMNFN